MIALLNSKHGFFGFCRNTCLAVTVTNVYNLVVCIQSALTFFRPCYASNIIGNVALLGSLNNRLCPVSESRHGLTNRRSSALEPDMRMGECNRSLVPPHHLTAIATMLSS